MKAKYAKEYKKYGIRSANKPQEGYYLAGVVQVADTEGKGYVFIKFSEALVEAVGKALPHGVGEESPAYLKVLHLHKLDRWRVFAYSLESTHGVLLWETQQKPEWLKRVRRK